MKEYIYTSTSIKRSMKHAKTPWLKSRSTNMPFNWVPFVRLLIFCILFPNIFFFLISYISNYWKFRFEWMEIFCLCFSSIDFSYWAGKLFTSQIKIIWLIIYQLTFKVFFFNTRVDAVLFVIYVYNRVDFFFQNLSFIRNSIILYFIWTINA